MQAFSFVTEDHRTNFGDDLNRWLWKRFLPDPWWGDDGVLFCGIGTVLGRALPPAKHYIAFSCGAGYDPLPKDLATKWTIVCVRGPLTARVLGLPGSKAVCDGACLLSSLPEGAPLPESERSGVVFMPHFDIMDTGDWPEICRRAGVEFLDPSLPSEELLDRIRRARLVLADAMHAAIVADAVRVPWVPLVTSRRINTFKWLDWALALDLPYRPIELPSPTLLESIRNRTLKYYGLDYSIEEKSESAALAHYERNKTMKEAPNWEARRIRNKKLGYWAPNRLLRQPIFASAVAKDTAARLDRCAQAMYAAIGSTAYLSDEKTLRGRAAQLEETLKEVCIPAMC